MRTAITKIKFYSVSRDIKASTAVGAYSSIELAKKHHISRESVSAIKRAKTWPGMLLMRQTKTSRDHEIKQARYDKKRAVVLEGREDRQNKKIDNIINRVRQMPVSYEQFEELYGEVRRVRERVEAMESNSQRKRGFFKRRG